MTDKEFDDYVKKIFRTTKPPKVYKVIKVGELYYALNKKGRVVSVYGERTSKALKQLANKFNKKTRNTS